VSQNLFADVYSLINRTLFWQGWRYCATIYMRIFRKLLNVLPFLLLTFCGCNQAFFEKDTRVSIIDINNPPTFKLSGSGILMRFIVSGPYSRLEELEHTATGNTSETWEISPTGYAGKEASKLPTVNYGVLPPGFTQITPKEGSPLQLKEDMYYAIALPSISANYRRLCFTIQSNKAIKVSCSEK
jgi:hypothetical protein